MNDVFDYDVFLSFASEDEDTARPIWQELCLNGLRVFWSDKSLKSTLGSSWVDVIEEALQRSRHFLLLVTPASMASAWVKREYKAFHSQCYRPDVRRLIPLLAAGYKFTDLPLFLRELQACHLSEATAVKQIVQALGGTNISELKGQLTKLESENDALRHQLAQSMAKTAELSTRLDQLAREKSHSASSEVKNQISTPTHLQPPQSAQPAHLPDPQFHDKLDGVHMREKMYIWEWVIAQRKRAAAEVAPTDVLLELSFLFSGSKPELGISQLKARLEAAQIRGLNSLIGCVSAGEVESKLSRGPQELYAVHGRGESYSYWAANTKGDLYYLRTVPLTADGAIPIELLLRETTELIRYVLKFAVTVGAERDDWRLLIQLSLHNVGERAIGTREHDSPLAAELRTLKRRPTAPVESAIEVYIKCVKPEHRPSIIKMIFDDFIAYFDFLTVPASYYAQSVVASAAESAG